MKQILLLITTSFFLLFLFLSSSSGRSGKYAGAPSDFGTCSNCHTSTGSGSITFSGAPSSYEAGQTYNMTLVINDISASIGGFQVVATNGITNDQIGTFIPISGQKINDENRLVQSAPKSFEQGKVSWPIQWTAPMSGPSNIQFYFAGNAANGNGNLGSGDNGYNGSTSLIPLPIELTSFSAALQQGRVVLNWATASQRAFSHFVVEKSSNGIAFLPIGQVTGKTNSSTNLRYSFADNNVSSKTAYYRLKSVDLDGSFEHSKILSVQSKGQQHLTLYPNPIQQSDLLRVSSKNFQNNEIDIVIYDLNGRLIIQNRIQSNDNLIQIELAKWSVKTGNYFATFAVQGKIIGQTQLMIK